MPPQRSDGLAADTVWNAVANVAAAVMSFALPALTSHISGAYWCGVVALGLAMSQQLFNIGSFGTNSYQASDIAEARTFPDYVAAKGLSVAAMLAAATLWLLIDWPGHDKAASFLAMMLYQTSEAFSGAFFSRYQQKGRLDTACRVRFTKTIAFASVFAIVLCATRQPLPALVAAATTHAALFLALDVPLLSVFGPLHPKLPGRSALSILLACAPLAANAFFLIYLHNAPRFAVDSMLDEVAFAKFTALFIVSFGIAVCADFILNPQVVRMATAIRRGNRSGAFRTIRSPLFTILCLGTASVALAPSLGIPALSFLFHLDLAEYGMALRLILIGGTFVALGSLAQMVLTVLRRQVLGIPGLAAAVAFSAFAARPLVARHGILGAAIAYLASVALLALCSGSIAVPLLLKDLSRHYCENSPDSLNDIASKHAASAGGKPRTS